jgi:hypothetical protein
VSDFVRGNIKIALDFFNLLTGPELLEMTEAHLPEHRERLDPPTVTLSMFMKQSLALDRSCQRVVDAWAGQRAAEGLSVQSIRTGGYCRARTRLPLPMIVALTRETGRLLSAQAPREWRWRDRCVKLADGTGISMPDTAQNQARYPQPRSQAALCIGRVCCRDSRLSVRLRSVRAGRLWRLCGMSLHLE